MKPWDWYLKVLRQYVDFSGRARRKEYWFFALFTLLVSLTLMFIDMAITGQPTDGKSGGGLLYSLYSLAVFLPSWPSPFAVCTTLTTQGGGF